MKPIIDIHAHVLPGVDDGCKTKEEALEMMGMYESQNVCAVICTPHYGPCSVEGADPEKAYEWLSATGSPVRLLMGNEIYFTRSTLLDVRRGFAHTLAGSKHVLIEFEDWAYATPAEDIYNALKWFAQTEYTPILAHPERYQNLQYNPDFYEKIAKTGTKLQINAYDVVENDNPVIKKTTQRLLKKRLVSFIGSDAHGSVRRAPALQTGVKWIYDNCPETYADAVVHDNAAKIIGGA